MTNEGEKRAGWWAHIKDHSGTEADRRNQRRFALLTFLWGASFIAATWLLRSDSDPPAAVGWIVAIIPIVLAGVALSGYMRFLRDADELIRRIQLEALGVGVAAGLVYAIGYPLLEKAGAPLLGREWIWSTVVLVISLAFAVGSVIGVKRYR